MQATTLESDETHKERHGASHHPSTLGHATPTAEGSPLGEEGGTPRQTACYPTIYAGTQNLNGSRRQRLAETPSGAPGRTDRRPTADDGRSKHTQGGGDNDAAPSEAPTEVVRQPEEHGALLRRSVFGLADRQSHRRTGHPSRATTTDRKRTLGLPRGRLPNRRSTDSAMEVQLV